MKIQIVSDLHLEFGDYTLPQCERDLLIVAGDVHVGKKAVSFLKEQLEWSPVVYILGNHEFYEHDIETITTFYKELHLPGLHVLDNSGFEMDCVRFLGCTLWTDANQQNAIDIQNVKGGLNDFRLIKNGDRIFTVQDSINRHLASVMWLSNELKKPYNGKTVIITHHLPSLRSIDPKYSFSALNYAFASDLDNIIVENAPTLWIHGHTHESANYQIGATKVICNPRGYYNEINSKFDPHLIINL
ncbi:hypothetical protein NEF87_003824 [Candidatus Lokiarchaeum ossiferum]|uniref:Calcineurin-like phosphoesterase domain-containing protein n=1 Tax=Candidatus Lokiarchaeum ossiferum TaxID=2951803 RepID=A0ABY6HYB5_9ARCH|nr:hypothetical protein NEF87_003824 [Candidatus Lokiarchaeum sp. B-35]